MFKFIHTADIHLDSPMIGLERYEGAPVEKIRCATRHALQNMIDLAIKEKVDFLLMCGDLYDGEWKDYNTGLFLISELLRLREAGIRVFIISGNHDAESQITRSLRMPENVKIFSTRKPETITIGNLDVAIHGQGFARRAVMENLALAYPKALPHFFNIGMLHTSVTGREGHEPYAPCAKDDLLLKEYDYWALGHVHTREILNENPWIVFPGNIQGRHIHEAGPKGFSIVTVGDDGAVIVEEHYPDVVRWETCRVNASGSDTPEDVIEKARAAIRNILAAADGRFLAMRVLIDGRCKAHNELSKDQEKWKTELKAMATDESNGTIWIEKIRMDTRSQIAIEDLMGRKDPIGDLLTFIQDIASDEKAPSAHHEEVTELHSQIAEEMKRLQSKLPADIKRQEEWLDLDEPKDFRALLGAAREILISRLLDKDGRQ